MHTPGERAQSGRSASARHCTHRSLRRRPAVDRSKPGAAVAHLTTALVGRAAAQPPPVTGPTRLSEVRSQRNAELYACLPPQIHSTRREADRRPSPDPMELYRQTMPDPSDVLRRAAPTQAGQQPAAKQAASQKAAGKKAPAKKAPAKKAPRRLAITGRRKVGRLRGADGRQVDSLPKT